jgi:hypothetical protein
LSEVHLLGAFSNRDTAEQLDSLGQLRRRILASTSFSPSRESAPPQRIGAVPKAIAEVLSQAGERMHTSAIHRAVEHRLGRSVNYRTVKACLSNEAKAKRPRFERAAYGQYRLTS